jgi:glyoxylate reductase
MTSKIPRVVVTRKLPDRIETRLRELFDARLNRDDRPLTAAELAEAVAQADVLVPTVTDRISAAVIGAAGPRLRLIASFGTGVDHIDLDAAKARGILVANTPGVLTEDTADTTMALILAVMRRLTEGERLVRAGEWEGWSPTSMLGHRPAGKKLAIVGMGRIGMAVARRARAFGMSIHYHNRRRLPPEREAEVGATWWESLDQMLVQADVVSINCPHTPATFHLLSARRLALMRPHAYLVNTARGEVVDEAALVRALERRELAGAGLDVYAREPAIDRRLLALDNVVCLPHMGSATLEGRIAMGERVLINIRAFADGHAVPDRVVGTGF